jgi:hypothetical protein
MRTPPSRDIFEGLVNNLGFVPNKDIFRGVEPSMPHETLTVYDTHARRTRLVYDPEELIERISLQVRVRGRNQDETYERAGKVVDYLEKQYNITWGNYRYLMFWADWGLGLLDQDNNNRWRFYVNLETQRVPNTNI